MFMKETIRALQSRANVHVVSFVDHEGQLESQKALLPECQSAQFLVRPHISLADQWTLTPNAIREFGVRDFAWAIHRTILLKKIDVVQLEYTTMGQYAGQYRNIPCMLFEHDISAQSLWRRIKAGDRDFDTLLEYLRMRLYEPKLLKRVARVQVCSKDNAKYLRTLASGLKDRIDCDIRATIDVGGYECATMTARARFAVVYRKFPSFAEPRCDPLVHWRSISHLFLKSVRKPCFTWLVRMLLRDGIGIRAFGCWVCAGHQSPTAAVFRVCLPDIEWFRNQGEVT